MQQEPDAVYGVKVLQYRAVEHTVLEAERNAAEQDTSNVVDVIFVPCREDNADTRAASNSEAQ